VRQKGVIVVASLIVCEEKVICSDRNHQSQREGSLSTNRLRKIYVKSTQALERQASIILIRER
jgi:hypothetical protein